MLPQNTINHIKITNVLSNEDFKSGTKEFLKQELQINDEVFLEFYSSVTYPPVGDGADLTPIDFLDKEVDFKHGMIVLGSDDGSSIVYHKNNNHASEINGLITINDSSEEINERTIKEWKDFLEFLLRKKINGDGMYSVCDKCI